MYAEKRLRNCFLFTNNNYIPIVATIKESIITHHRKDIQIPIRL